MDIHTFEPSPRLEIGRPGHHEPEGLPVRIPDFPLAPYRPDSAVDGWRAGPFTVRAASVRGDAHRQRGVPRQDDMALGWHAGSATLVVAVADGVSSAPLSHIGATAACRYAVEAVVRDIAAGRDPDWRSVIEGCAWALIETAQRLEQSDQPDPEQAERILATTLCALAVGPSPGGITGQAVAVGDSGVGMVRGEAVERLLGGRANDPGAVTDLDVVALPRVPARPATSGWDFQPGDLILVGTDGIWDPLGDGTGSAGRYLATSLSGSLPSRSDFLRIVDFGRETFDDDRTLIAIQADQAEQGLVRGTDQPDGSPTKTF